MRKQGKRKEAKKGKACSSFLLYCINMAMAEEEKQKTDTDTDKDKDREREREREMMMVVTGCNEKQPVTAFLKRPLLTYDVASTSAPSDLPSAGSSWAVGSPLAARSPAPP